MLTDFGTTRALWIAIVVNLATIGGAWALQWYGYDPCHLCLLERWPYYIAMPLAVVILGATDSATKLRRAGVTVIGLIFIGSAIFGAYHSGVEWGWWPGPSSCTGNNLTGGLPDLTRKVVLCDSAALRILGLSLAGWNAVISAALAILLLGAARTETRAD